MLLVFKIFINILTWRIPLSGKLIKILFRGNVRTNKFDLRQNPSFSEMHTSRYYGEIKNRIFTNRLIYVKVL